MKLRFILSTLWLLSALSVCAQHADDNRYEGTGLQAYLEFCLSQREAMQKKSTDQLRECIEESTQSEFRFNDVRILMQELGDDLEEVIVPGVPKVSMEYTPDYVDQLLMHDTDYRDDELEGPALMRDAEAANCLYTHKALGPKQAGVYRIQCAGENRLICVPSPDGLVSVNVSSTTRRPTSVPTPTSPGRWTTKAASSSPCATSATSPSPLCWPWNRQRPKREA